MAKSLQARQRADAPPPAAHGDDGTAAPCWRAASPTMCVLHVRVQPNARRTEAVGLADGALRVKLAAPPIDGRANDVLLAWLADELGLAKRAVRLRRGASARHKQVEVDLGEADLAAWARRLLDAAR